MAKSDRTETLPSAVEALEDPEAAEKRAEHRERTYYEVLKEYGVKEGQEPPQPAPPPESRQPKVKVIDDDPEALSKLMDPFRGTEPRDSTAVWTKDSYGNIVKTAV